MSDRIVAAKEAAMEDAMEAAKEAEQHQIVISSSW